MIALIAKVVVVVGIAAAGLLAVPDDYLPESLENAKGAIVEQVDDLKG